jgi:Lrp/AsnC family leucine-responsive transcriptional regulator
MPLQLDDYDVSILRSLLKDGRKSFRKISRETGITTPTVKARFTRLVNIGFIKSVSPIFDTSLVENECIFKPDFDKQQRKKDHRNYSIRQLNQQLQDGNGDFKVKKALKIKMDCQFCKGPISGSPQVYKFANYERFFCCKACMSGYKQKYAGRIESIKRRYAGKED